MKKTAPHILVICTANICRSPVVEAVLRQRLAAQDLEEWTVSSAGTWAENDRGAAAYSVQLMSERGLDISSHLSRVVTRELLQAADLILCMTESHAESLRTEFSSQIRKIYLLTEMAGRRYNISDPYGGSLTDYIQMTNEVTALIDAGLPRIVDLAQQLGGKVSS